MAQNQNPAVSLTMRVVTIAVAIIIISSVAIPLIEDSQDQITTYELNTDYQFRASVTEGNINLSITAVSVSADTYTVNGATVVASGIAYQYQFDGFLLDMLGGTFRGADLNITALADGDTIVITNSSLVFTHNGSVAATGAVHFLICPDVYGDYVCYNKASMLSRPIVDNDATFYMFSFYSTSLRTITAVTNGVGSVISQYVAGSGETDYSLSLNLVTEPYNAHAFKFSTLAVTMSDAENSYTDSGANLYVPLKYSVTDSSSTEYTLIGVIPIMLILVVLMYAVAFIRARS